MINSTANPTANYQTSYTNRKIRQVKNTLRFKRWMVFNYPSAGMTDAQIDYLTAVEIEAGVNVDEFNYGGLFEACKVAMDGLDNNVKNFCQLSDAIAEIWNGAATALSLLGVDVSEDYNLAD